MSVKQRNNVNILGKQDAAQTIMFGHGFGTDQTSFYPVVKAFENDYRIVLYDTVGGGASDIEAYSSQRYSTLQGYVTDLSEICKELGIKDAIFVGQSIGGMIGLLMNNKYPGHFSKLIMLGSSPRYLNDASRWYTGGFEQSDLDGLYEAMTSNFYAWASGFSTMVMANPDRPQLAENFAKSLSSVRPDIALQMARAIFQSDNRFELEHTTIPVLIVQTTQDVAVPESVGTYMYNQIPDATLMKVNIAGHFPHISAPDEVIDAIKSFI